MLLFFMHFILHALCAIVEIEKKHEGERFEDFVIQTTQNMIPTLSLTFQISHLHHGVAFTHGTNILTRLSFHAQTTIVITLFPIIEMYVMTYFSIRVYFC